MRKWECIVCGWVYDEAVGAPDSGIPAGTRWEDVPEDFLCPDCGVGKEDFELLEDGSQAAAESNTEDKPTDTTTGVVIIGTGMSGYNLAKEFRKLDGDTSVTIISADDGSSYSKPMLSTGYTRNTEAQALVVASAEEMGKQLGITMMTNTRVTEIDTKAHTLSTNKGHKISYSALVLAVGSSTIPPPLEGDAMDKVYSVNDLQDYARFRDALRELKAKKLFIIGAGLIGSEFANDLRNGDFEIEAVDPLAHTLSTLLPPEAGASVQAALSDHGVRYHFGTVAERVNHAPDGKGVVIELKDGNKTHADLVVSAVGVRPRVDLAKSAGIKTNRGIVVDQTLRTSEPDVYALGDCAEVEGLVLYFVAPLMACSRALAKTLSGTPTKVHYPAMPITIKTPFCPVVVSPPPRDSKGKWHIDKDGHDVCAEYRNSDNQLLGFALTGKRTAEKIRLQKELPPLLA
jgi:rubredoxin-NAD+ reductase